MGLADGPSASPLYFLKMLMHVCLAVVEDQGENEHETADMRSRKAWNASVRAVGDSQPSGLGKRVTAEPRASVLCRGGAREHRSSSEGRCRGLEELECEERRKGEKGDCVLQPSGPFTDPEH